VGLLLKIVLTLLNKVGKLLAKVNGLFDLFLQLGSGQENNGERWYNICDLGKEPMDYIKCGA